MLPAQFTGLALGIGLGGLPLIIWLLMKVKMRVRTLGYAVVAVIGLAPMAYMGLTFWSLRDSETAFCPQWASEIEGMKLLQGRSSTGMMSWDEIAVVEIPADKLNAVLTHSEVRPLNLESKGLAYESTFDQWLPESRRRELEKSGAYLLGHAASGTYRATLLIDQSRANVFTVYYRRSK